MNVVMLNQTEKPKAEFTPEMLESASGKVAALVHELVHGVDQDGADLFAAQNFAMALSFLEHARNCLTMSQYDQTRALASLSTSHKV
jgi:hypothetical protein